MEHDEPILHDNLTIIEVTDPLVLDALAADASAAALGLARLSQLVAAVHPRHCDALIARLRKLGHLPKVVD